MIKFHFPIQALSKDRPRFWQGRVLTSKSTRQFEKTIQIFAQQQYKDKPLEGALRCDAWFIFKTPKKSKNNYPAKKDLDNLSKAVLDALNGIAWVDDRQITILQLTKQYGRQDEIILNISSLAEETPG